MLINNQHNARLEDRFPKRDFAFSCFALQVFGQILVRSSLIIPLCLLKALAPIPVTLWSTGPWPRRRRTSLRGVCPPRCTLCLWVVLGVQPTRRQFKHWNKWNLRAKIKVSKQRAKLLSKRVIQTGDSAKYLAKKDTEPLCECCTCEQEGFLQTGT